MLSQTRSTRGRQNCAQPHLVFTNDDLLTEILIRLPILCIHLFTTVSKQWLQILTSPDFTDKRRKIPNLDPPVGIFANHLRSLLHCDFVSLDSRLNSKKSTMYHSFGSDEEGDHVRILQSFNGLLLELKEEALRNKAILEGLINDDDESSNNGWKRWDGYEIADHDHEEREYKNKHEYEERCELFNDHELPVCNIRRFEMTKYSFGDDEEYVADLAEKKSTMLVENLRSGNLEVLES
ncbi:ribonuclease H-like domain-containing protein [Tanacetum coccineum]